MFPRIMTYTKKDITYSYLVISESIYESGKGSTTKNVANLGNLSKFSNQDIESLIDGFIKIFKLEKYALSDEVEILESLEHGSIIFWQKLWEDLGINAIIKRLTKCKDKRIKLEVEKYIELMTINRCVVPLSKLAITRWIETTCYKEMKGYEKLPLDVTYFYRSMDHLLKIKDKLELYLFETLKNLFSINVKLTFYDITSTFFYTDNCDISAHGYSRDNRPDKEQIIIGVVTSYEGYPIKHYVFTGETKDEATVGEVVKNLKKEYNIEETTFVGDRGMITKLNLDRIEGEGFNYIMGVKIRQDEICEMLFDEDDKIALDIEEYKGLKLRERIIKIKDFLIWKTKEILKENRIVLIDNKFNLLEEEILNLENESKPELKRYKTILSQITQEIDSKVSYKIFKIIQKYSGRYEDELRYIICLNEERKSIAKNKREGSISKISIELDKLFSNKEKTDLIKSEKSLNKIFEGYKSKLRKYFYIEREDLSKKAIGYNLNTKAIEQEEKLDGIFVLLSNRMDPGLEKSKIVESYKNLKEIEMLFDDLKNFVDIRPIRHWLIVRVRAHVFICILSLLLKRIFEINYMKGKALTEALEEISKSKLIKYKVKFSKREERIKTFPKVTNTTPTQKKYFNMIGIKNPMSLEKFV
jgi:transposase